MNILTLNAHMPADDADLSDELRHCLPKSSGFYWDGKWQPSGSGERFVSINPSTGEMLAELNAGAQEEVDLAVASALRASAGWAALPPLDRANRLKRAASIIRAHAVELALIDAADCGNPVKAMLNDAEIAALQLEYFAGLALELKGETIPTADGSINYTVREPFGVVVRIFPFNHPFMFAAGKIAAPLVVGNTVVIKPPEQAPLSTVRLFELLDGVFPPGVLNCVVGDRSTGAALCGHPDVSAVGLIGSVQAGKAVLKGAADTMKRTLLELGGKNAMIIFPDAEFDKAVDGAVRGMNFTWCGQSCGSTSRLFLHERIYDQFIDALVKRVQQCHRPGIATRMSTTMGALVSQAQYERTLSYIDKAQKEGARLVYGGKHPEGSDLQNGFFIEPTVFLDVTPDMTLAKEEVFGPVLAVFKWSDESGMLAAVNGTDFGLTASIWTTQLANAHRTASKIQAGYIWVNNCSAHILGAPFGGYKSSGLGREESKEEMFEFTQLKNINISI